MMDDGNQEIEGVKKIIGEISQFMNEPLIVVKSTILPNNALDLKKRYSNIVFNPEFLLGRGMLKRILLIQKQLFLEEIRKIV